MRTALRANRAEKARRHVPARATLTGGRWRGRANPILDQADHEPSHSEPLDPDDQGEQRVHPRPLPGGAAVERNVGPPRVGRQEFGRGRVCRRLIVWVSLHHRSHLHGSHANRSHERQEERVHPRLREDLHKASTVRWPGLHARHAVIRGGPTVLGWIRDQSDPTPRLVCPWEGQEQSDARQRQDRPDPGSAAAGSWGGLHRTPYEDRAIGFCGVIPGTARTIAP
jgi:hypothetical protein